MSSTLSNISSWYTFIYANKNASEIKMSSKFHR